MQLCFLLGFLFSLPRFPHFSLFSPVDNTIRFCRYLDVRRRYRFSIEGSRPNMGKHTLEYRGSLELLNFDNCALSRARENKKLTSQVSARNGIRLSLADEILIRSFRGSHTHVHSSDELKPIEESKNYTAGEKGTSMICNKVQERRNGSGACVFEKENLMTKSSTYHVCELCEETSLMDETQKKHKSTRACEDVEN